ncbi:monooxygenase [Massilibacterium senegalense]|uniref:monooxygenase n=1 Tax=Massilibacterium senegalense TaxID=1632858 RepID=UPI000783C0C8|nr:monooxygenase [Massilibacterium senegalense]
MTKKLVQIDFPADGPFGEEMSTAYKELAESIEKEPGLIWKIWTENAETKEAGGVYYFEDEESAKKYVKMHTKRLQSFGISGIRSKMFNVNEKLTAITKGPIQ